MTENPRVGSSILPAERIYDLNYEDIAEIYESNRAGKLVKDFADYFDAPLCLSIFGDCT